MELFLAKGLYWLLDLFNSYGRATTNLWKLLLNALGGCQHGQWFTWALKTRSRTSQQRTMFLRRSKDNFVFIAMKFVFRKSFSPVALSDRTPPTAWPWTACRGRRASTGCGPGEARPSGSRGHSCRRQSGTTSCFPDKKRQDNFRGSFSSCWVWFVSHSYSTRLSF